MDNTISSTDRAKQYEDGLFPFVVMGNPQGENLIFLAGYPDNELSGWAPLFDLLKHKYQIISICFPQFDEKPSKLKPWAYDFDELIEMLDKTLANTPAANQPYILITHDWGAQLGYMYENKYSSKVGKMIAVDIGQSMNITWRHVLYQSILAFIYLISQVLGAAIASLVMKFYAILMSGLPFLSPLTSAQDKRHFEDICKPTVDMAYPYYYTYRAIFTGNMKKLRSRFPSCPFLFMYGKVKGVMFHNAAFLEKIERSPICSSVEFLDCGHWIMDVAPEKMANDIEKFLASQVS